LPFHLRREEVLNHCRSTLKGLLLENLEKHL
jgi:hypothetical protein